MGDEKKENMIKAAEKLLKQGRIQQALAQYEKILSHSPDDTYVLNRIGDLYAQFGKHAEAKKYFKKIATHYETKGFEPQAMAIWKKILKLDAVDGEACFKLAELFQNRSLIMEAKRYYLTSAESFMNQEDYDNARKSYERLLLLEPDNMKLREKIGEVLIAAGRQDQGAGEYLRMASDLEKQGSLEKAMKYYRKAIDIDPASLNAAESFLERISLNGMKEQAIFFAEDLFFNMPEKGQAASILANLFIKLKRYSDASKVLDKREEIVGSEAILEASEDKSSRQKAPAAIIVEEEARIQDEESVGLLKKSEFIEKQITLADVYQKYQIYDQVVHHLDEILKKFPDDHTIRERLIPALDKAGERERMVKESLRLAENFERNQQKDKVEAILQKALEMAPEDHNLQKNLDLIKEGQPMEIIQEEPPTEEDVPLEEGEETFDIEIDEQEEDDEKYESISRSLGILKEKIKEEIESDDYKSHYDLGIAYKEMGLIEEAIQEFNVARGSQEYFILSSLMMGLCHRLKGDLDAAEKVITEGLESAQNDEQKMEFWYELADILFQKEEYQESLNLLNHILKIDPKYRNTSIKAEKLIELIEEASQE